MYIYYYDFCNFYYYLLIAITKDMEINIIINSFVNFHYIFDQNVKIFIADYNFFSLQLNLAFLQNYYE